MFSANFHDFYCAVTSCQLLLKISKDSGSSDGTGLMLHRKQLYFLQLPYLCQQLIIEKSVPRQYEQQSYHFD